MSLFAFAFAARGYDDLTFVRHYNGGYDDHDRMISVDWEKWTSEAETGFRSDEYCFDAEGNVWRYVATGWHADMEKQPESVGRVYALICDDEGYIEASEKNFSEKIEQYSFTI